MALTAKCPLHEGSILEEKDGIYGPYFSHRVEGVGYCNGKKITPFKKQVETSPVAPKTTPNSDETREAVQQEAAPYFDMRSYRIERQHSQSVAVEFLDYCMKWKLDPDKEILIVKRMTSYFHKDLDKDANEN